MIYQYYKNARENFLENGDNQGGPSEKTTKT